MWSTLEETAFSYTRCMDVYASPTTYVYHTLRTQLGRSRTALCSKCTIPHTSMALKTFMGTTLAQTAFSYTRCMDEYSSTTTYGYHRLWSQLGRCSRAFYTRCTIPETRIALHISIWTSLQQTTFLHTRYMEVYCSPTTNVYHRLCS